MSLLEKQVAVSPQRGMPTNDLKQSSKVQSVTGETVQLYYSNAGVRTADAGQLAGVAVHGKLLYDNVKDSTGVMSGTKADTSLSFTAGALVTEVNITPAKLEGVDGMSFATKLTALTEGLANGEYVVDYVNGTIWGKKASAATTLANVAYKIQSGLTSATIIGDITVDSEFPVAAALADNTANPTTTSVAAMNMVFDGTTWDRLPGTSTDGMTVNLGTNNDVVIGANSTIGDGAKDVTTAGTQVALAASTAVKSVTVQAKAANTGSIYVGGSGVSSATGIALMAGDAITLEIDDLAKVYVDSSVNGEGITFTYLA